MGCLQATYIPGLGKGGAERALTEAVPNRPDRRGGGVGRTLMQRAVERARARLRTGSADQRQEPGGRTPFLHVARFRRQPRGIQAGPLTARQDAFARMTLCDASCATRWNARVRIVRPSGCRERCRTCGGHPT
ncbi:hypothetical protein [Streptomyces sp. NPDC046759]|uniref:hypothetical protein n=1 Tax=Streptomyces sp. NPDC046759 TaxID=3155019 RepID=UPI0033C0B20B